LGLRWPNSQYSRRNGCLLSGAIEWCDARAPDVRQHLRRNNNQYRLISQGRRSSRPTPGLSFANAFDVEMRISHIQVDSYGNIAAFEVWKILALQTNSVRP